MENRSVKRRHLWYYLRVFDGKTNQLLGHVADITTKGLMLMSEAPLPTQTEYRLKMILPEPISGRRDSVFRARSVWHRRDVNPDFFVTGFEILDIEAQDATIIEELIEGFGFRD